MATPSRDACVATGGAISANRAQRLRSGTRGGTVREAPIDFARAPHSILGLAENLGKTAQAYA